MSAPHGVNVIVIIRIGIIVTVIIIVVLLIVLHDNVIILGRINIGDHCFGIMHTLLLLLRE